jgi:hypothetical protein
MQVQQWPERSPAVVSIPVSPVAQAPGEAMSINRVDQTVVTEETTPVAGQDPLPPAGARETVRTDTHRTTRSGPGSSELARRIVILLFGLIQIVIGARFVLLLLDAREANGLVSAVLSFSDLFVGPFEGILRTNFLRADGSVLDITAIVAFVGWTIIEVIVLWVLGIFRREPA